MSRDTCRIFTATVAVASVAVSALPAQEAVPAIDSIFGRWDAAGRPGAAVVVVKGGHVVHRAGYGTANIEHGIPITAETVFDIASVSKQFAGFAISMLVDQGKVDLDEDIRRHIPEVPDFGRTITVRHLVHHTAGLRDWPGTLAIAGWRMDDVISFDQILRMAYSQRDLNFEPGAEYSYSNTGYNLLAELVRRVTGRTFREWTEEHIFLPLGMHGTHFHDDHREIVPNSATSYVSSGGRLVVAPNGLTALGSSSLYSTADDLAKWAINFETAGVGGSSVLGRMHERGILHAGDTIAYAYGQSRGDFHGHETWSHSGSWAGFRTYLLRVPALRFAVVVLSNDASFNASARAFDVAHVFWPDEGVTDGDDAETTAPVVVPGTELDRYVGTYRLGPAWLVTIRREGDALRVQATEEPEFPMVARSKTEFFVAAYGASINFRPAGRGPVQLIEYRGIAAPRVELRPMDGVSLGEYAGRYRSEELNTAYVFRVAGDTLVAWHFRHGDVPFHPVFADEFRGGVWYLRAAMFDRDASGRVVAVRFDNGRSRNVRFERVR